MPSIFDWLNPTPQTASLGGSPILGGADPIVPSILDTKAYRNQQIQDTLLGMSKALLQAGAPSPYPRGFADAFGAAGVGAAEGAGAGEDKYLKRALVDSQVQAQRQELLADKAFQEAIRPKIKSDTAGVPSMPGIAPATGVAGGVIPPEWEPHYDRASASTGLSKELLKAKDLVESGGNAGAVSSKGATGPAQLMPGTAADLGVTNAKDPAQAIPAGATYLKQMYTKYGNAEDALAAYNWGPGNVDKWIAGGRDPNQMPAETKNYIAQIKGRLQPSAAPPTMTAQTPPPTAAPPVAAPPAMPPAAGPQGMALNAAPPSTPPVQVAGGPVAQLPPVAPPPLGPQGGPVGGGELPPANASGTPLPPQAMPGGVTPAQYQPPSTLAPTAPAPAGPAPKSLSEVIETIPPGVRELLGTMKRKEAMPLLMKYADPETHTAIDTTTGQIVFAPKNDNSGRYQPVDAAKIDIDRQRLDVERRQAAAREKQADTASRNAPVGPDGQPSPGVPQAAGAIEAAKDTAKVGPALLKYQGEEAIKDHQVSQQAAAAARTSNANLDRLQSLLEKVSTGKGTETINDIKAAAKAVGIDLTAMGIADDVGPVQAAKALTSKMTLDLGSAPDGGLKGSFSDKDVVFLKSGIPGLDTTPEGRKLMVEYQKRVNQRAIDVAGIKNDYMRSPQFTTDPAGMWAKVKQYADAHPLFDKEEDKVAAATSSAGAPTGAVPAPPAGFRVIK